MLIKVAEATINPDDIRPTDEILRDADLHIEQEMIKLAAEHKAIAPLAQDFLYFTCVMMHAAEASLVDDNGDIKKIADKPLEAKWERVGKDSIRWSCTDPSIRPYKNSNCLVAGTDILMADGSRKAIEDIVVGDEVITHKGRVRKVTETFKHENNSQIFNIKTKNHPKLQITSEHPLYALSNEKVRKLSLRDAKKSVDELRWVKAQDISAGDFLTSISVGVNKNSDITTGQARLLGLFAAEGSYSKKYGKRQSAVFTFGLHEPQIAALVKEIVEREFPECSVSIRESASRNIINVTVTGHGIAEWFYENVGEYSHEKKLSTSLVFASDDIKKQFILGWLEGDGCITDGNKLVGISTSPHLAWQVWTMARSMGLNISIRKVSNCKRFVQINKEYKEYPCKDHYRLEFYGGNAEKICTGSVKYDVEKASEKQRPAEYFIDSYSLHRVRDIEIEQFEGFVYNFEVEEDHSYIANGIVVHNSDIFPEFELKKAYKAWKGRPLCLDHKSASVDMIRGVIVDTYYDERRKRVIALCALDKKNYPDLARKVASGYATNVSMGTAVGRAVCSEEGCHRVARTESDFCDHMRNKSCYGEINLDLAPIELSIVVSGADPNAKIKTILAHKVNEASKGLTAYMDKKLSTGKVSNEDLIALQKDLQSLAEKVGKLASDSEDVSEVSTPATESKPTMPQLEESGVTPIQTGAEPFPTYASELQRAVVGARIKLAKLTDDFQTLSSLLEGDMTKKQAYFQGTVEPTPGQTQYQPEPGEREARMQDKHMQGQSPFPDTGPVDGMHPGYESFGETEEQRKKRLQRLAEKEQRAARRKEAVAAAKRAYFQGTEEPKPGAQQYPVDNEPGEKARMDDKHMVGKSPFPDVGDIEGLYGDDKAVKEKLLRAELKARFKRAATPNGETDYNNSRWDVYAGDKLILSATVGEISRGNAETLFDSIATDKFGKKILKKIRSEGFEKTQSMLKQAQVPAPAAPAPATPPAEPAVAPVEEPALEPETPDVGGDSKTQVLEISDDLKDLGTDLEEIAGDLEGTMGPMEGEAAELEGVAPAAPDQFDEALPQTTASLQSMRKTLNGLLREGVKETVADLRAHAKELKLARELYISKYAEMDEDKRKYLNSLAASAYRDATETANDARKLMAAVVKYAHGTAGLVKRAAAEKDEKAKVKAEKAKAKEKEEKAKAKAKEKEEKAKAKAKEEKAKKASANTKEMAVGTETREHTGLESKEARAQQRMKLAQKGLSFMEVSQQAHPGGSRNVSDAANLDNAPKAPFAAFHVIDDTHDALENLAKQPPKVRKQAEEIMRLVQAGHIEASEVDGLVAHGIDSEAVSYWKQMWAEANDSESKEFANELTKEQAKQAAKEEIEAEKARLKRAYSVANEMVKRGMLESGQEDTQVGEMLQWNDKGFNDFHKFVTNQPIVKGAAGNGVTPTVGLLTSDQVILPSAESASKEPGDVRALFEDMLNRPNKRVIF